MIALDDAPDACWARVWKTIPFITVGRLLHYLVEEVFDHPGDNLLVTIESMVFMHEPMLEERSNVVLWTLSPDADPLLVRVRAVRDTRLRLRPSQA